MTTLLLLALAWLPGLDIITPVVEHGQLVAFVGYDRDTDTATRLDVAGRCFTTWTWPPSRRQGAVVHLLAINRETVVLYHESGHLRVETVPPVEACVPLPEQR